MLTFNNYLTERQMTSVGEIPVKKLWTDPGEPPTVKYKVTVGGKTSQFAAANDLCALRRALYMMCAKQADGIKTVVDMNNILKDKFGIEMSAERIPFTKLVKHLKDNSVQVLRIEGDGKPTNVLTKKPSVNVGLTH